MSINSVRRFRFRFAALPDFLHADLEAGRLKSVDLHLAYELVRLADGGIVHRTLDELAALAGKCVSTVKSALARLAACGHVAFDRARQRGYHRAICLSWLFSKSASDTANFSPPQQPIFTPSEAQPPPIRDPEEESQEDDDDSGSASRAGAHEAPSQSSSFDSSPPRKATNAEVAQTIEHAVRLFPGVPHIGPQIRHQAQLCAAAGGGLSWVQMALAEAEESKARSFGHIVVTLNRWREQGYASPRHRQQPAPGPQGARRAIEERERLERQRVRKEDEALPEGEELAALRAMAANPADVAGRLAAAKLRRFGLSVEG